MTKFTKDSPWQISIDIPETDLEDKFSGPIKAMLAGPSLISMTVMGKLAIPGIMVGNDPHNNMATLSIDMIWLKDFIMKTLVEEVGLSKMTPEQVEEHKKIANLFDTVKSTEKIDNPKPAIKKKNPRLKFLE